MTFDSIKLENNEKILWSKTHRTVEIDKVDKKNNYLPEWVVNYYKNHHQDVYREMYIITNLRVIIADYMNISREMNGYSTKCYKQYNDIIEIPIEKIEKIKLTTPLFGATFFLDFMFPFKDSIKDYHSGPIISFNNLNFSEYYQIKEILIENSSNNLDMIKNEENRSLWRFKSFWFIIVMSVNILFFELGAKPEPIFSTEIFAQCVVLGIFLFLIVSSIHLKKTTKFHFQKIIDTNKKFGTAWFIIVVFTNLLYFALRAKPETILSSKIFLLYIIISTILIELVKLIQMSKTTKIYSQKIIGTDKKFVKAQIVVSTILFIIILLS